MDKPIKVTKRRHPNTFLEVSSLSKSTLNTRLRKERRKYEHLEMAAATFHGVALALREILERGDHVFNEKSRKSLRQRSHENSALFKLFVSESRNACNRAAKTLEMDKSSFDAKSDAVKKNLFQKVKTSVETATRQLNSGEIGGKYVINPIYDNAKLREDSEGEMYGSEDESNSESFSGDEKMSQDDTKSGRAVAFHKSSKHQISLSSAKVSRFLDIEAIGPDDSSSSNYDSDSMGSLEDFIKD